MITKRGYKNAAYSVEIYEGKVDAIIYNDKGTSFFYYRFEPKEVLGVDIPRDTSLLFKEQVEPFLADHGKDYDGFINELIQLAIHNGMEEKYDM